MNMYVRWHCEKWVGMAAHWLLYDRCRRRCRADLMHPFMVAWQHVCHHLSVSQHHSKMCPPTFGAARNRSFSYTLLRHQRGILYHCLELLSVASVGSLCFFTGAQATTYVHHSQPGDQIESYFEITPKGWS
jgi:hypothetical protein